MTKKQKKTLGRIIISVILTALCLVFDLSGLLSFIVFLVPYFISGYDVLLKAFSGIKNRQPFDENFLMAIATIGAFILGEYSEAVFVMLFYQIGEFFQNYAVGKSRKNISDLMDIRPDYANIKNEQNDLVKVSPFEVNIGDIIYVKPGEKVAIDGTVEEGSSTLDTVALTGESVPRVVSEGDSVISGCINLTCLLKIKTTKRFEESTVSKILDSVENAGAKKSKAERFISRFARYYTPIVCISALALAIVPPLLRYLFSLEPNFSTWIYRSLTFLVISCPCALVVRVPLCFFVGIGGASKKGILIKGANYIEALSKTKHVVFDKTGTITEGVFEVAEFFSIGISIDELFEYAALAESFSTHPISISLIKYYKKTLDKSRVSCFTEISGQGITAKIDGTGVAVGNVKLMESLGIKYVECNKIGTVVHVAINGRYAGYILISDRVKKNSEKTVSILKKMGIKRTVMLTGDRKEIGEYVAAELKIDSVYTELLPDEKVSIIEALLESKTKNDSLIFVGDGINDAPVLSRADVGVAMGGLGADAAIESADVVLMDDDPLKLVLAINVAKKCMRIAYENIYFSIGIKFLFLILGAFGIVNLSLAVFADVGVMFIAVLNSIRTLKI